MLHVILGLLSVQVYLITGEPEICQFQNLNADCRYRVDGSCLARITARIDKCHDPIAVGFTVTCEIPRVHFSHVFDKGRESVPIEGLSRDVDMEVKLTAVLDDAFNVEVDFHVKGLGSTDFMNHDVKFLGIEEHCPGLNHAAKIAVGVMCALLAVVLAMVVVLFMIRRQRQRAKEAQNSGNLVANAETAEPTSPPPTGQRVSISESQGEITNVRLSDLHGIDI